MPHQRPDTPNDTAKPARLVVRGIALVALAVLLLAGGATVLHGLFSPATGPRTPQASPSTSAQSYRPGFHITPAANWMNDPQRPFQLDGLWHFYYLYNQDYPTGNGTAWRHLTSPDLVHWTDRGTAIQKYTNGLGDIETGSTVVDRDGVAGHGKNAVIAIVTQQSDGVQRQSLFYSTDGGYRFASDAANPIMENPGVKDWRDPKVSWDAERKDWVLVLAEGHKLGIYTSTDLRAWTYRSGVETAGIGTVECPDLFQLDLDGDPKRPVWVLASSADRSAAGGTRGFAYWTGRFDGRTFTPAQAEPQWLDDGPDFYAAVTWADPGTTSRRFAMAWLNNWAYARDLPTTGWHGGQDTIPREIRLVTRDGVPRLSSSPLSAATDRTGRPATIDAAPDSARKTIATPASGFVADVHALPGDATDPGRLLIRLNGNDGAHTDIAYDPVDHRLTLDRRADSFAASAKADEVYRSPAATTVGAEDGRVRFTLIVDRSSVEIFGADGASLSALTFLHGGVTSIDVTNGLRHPARVDVAGVASARVRAPATHGP